MTARFKPFPPVLSRYGAPMGRASANLALDSEFDTPESLAVAGPAGEYDAGGAYWGLGGSEGPVYAVWRKGKGAEGVVYVRARGRESAKLVALGIEKESDNV
jgi:hypothetical protein